MAKIIESASASQVDHLQVAISQVEQIVTLFDAITRIAAHDPALVGLAKIGANLALTVANDLETEVMA